MIDKVRYRLRRLRYLRAISGETIESRFTQIYQKNLWFRNRESKSGAGSTLQATENVRSQLPLLLKKLGAENLVDLGCGDFNWMKQIDLPCHYIGLDIVPMVVEENTKQYGGETREFRQHDAISDPLPPESDAILCREVLFHLSFSDTEKVMQNILKSSARYLIATTCQALKENHDIRTGDFRNINLMLPPFCLPTPMDSVQDDAVNKDTVLAVWALAPMRSDKEMSA